MKFEVKVPAVGESITEATIGSWTKKSGEFVKRNEVIMQLETDKATVEVIAENEGVITITAPAGSVVQIGSTVASIDSDQKPTAGAANSSKADSSSREALLTPPSPPAKANKETSSPASSSAEKSFSVDTSHLSPAVQRVVNENNIDVSKVQGTGKDGRLTKADVLNANTQKMPSPALTPAPAPSSSLPKAVGNNMPAMKSSRQGDKKLVPMTTIRKRIAERLVESQQTTATLTTFNEIDMSKVSEIRNRYKDKFKEKYGVSLGFMGLFTKATIEALKAFPAVNAYIVEDQVEYHNYYNVGVAVSTEKGLMVPVIKDADLMTVAEIELAIKNYALKARDGKISIDDLNGGTFTISNGGVFGSLMSTPILNPPQSGILGLHKIEERPVVVNGNITVRPMMYVALSYDHRMIDGRESVSFLVRIKECMEDPERLLLEI